ncbi:MAG: AsmA-like C-terminal region-containing protein [Candidatus Korobacteraceae bacterium]
MPFRTEETISAPPQAGSDESTKRPLRWRREALWVVIAVLAVVVVLGCMLAAKWPFTRAALTQSLEQDSQAQVEIGSYRETYFPHPGCVAENVIIHRDTSSPKLTVRRLTIVGSYVGMLHRYIPSVIAEGAILDVPLGGLKNLFASNGNQQPTGTSVGEIDADDAQIVVATHDEDHPLAFQFHQLRLKDIDKDSAVHFIAALQTPEPTGDLQLQGKIGPFRRDQAGSTPLAGTYSFKNAKLEEFTGFGGVLSSDGKFNGQLQAINVNGSTETPDFQLDVGIHPVDLKTKFHALVNGTNGDLQLDPVTSSWGKTSVTWTGTIQGPDEAKAQKTVTLDMTSTSARVQDLLILFVHDEQSPMSGAINFRAHVTLLPGPEAFWHRLRLQDEFEIRDGKFTRHETQQEVEILSARARGQADKIEDDQDRDRKNGTDTVDRDLQPVVSSFKGRVFLRDGIAHFSDLSFDVPGATALLNGTYAIQSQRIDAQGTAHMETKLYKATTGVKSFLLKVIGPLRPHKSGDKGSTVLVHVTGTYGHPSFAVQQIKGGQ